MKDAQGWADTAIRQHVYRLGFVGADTTTNSHGAPVHRLPPLTAWLDDLLALDCNAYSSVRSSTPRPMGTTPSIIRLDRVDPRLGDEADVALLAACQPRGIRVLLDGVFNPCGRGHRWWQKAVVAGPGAAVTKVVFVEHSA